MRVLMWRIYAVLLVAVPLAVYLLLRKAGGTQAALPHNPVIGIISVIGQAIAWCSIAGVWGYAFGWRLIGPGLWRVVFVLTLLWIGCGLGVVLLVMGVFGAIGPLFPGGTAMLLGFGAAFIAVLGMWHVPMLVALYRYGFRCERFWRGPLARQSAPA